MVSSCSVWSPARLLNEALEHWVTPRHAEASFAFALGKRPECVQIPLSEYEDEDRGGPVAVDDSFEVCVVSPWASICVRSVRLRCA